jgi:TolB-like protein/Tfp pilus assembly protein PilF
MALRPGEHLGPYEILAPLGAGGMGEVYRARDPRLGRDVAVKVLPQEVASDPDRLRRFQREARAAGALNHPNILAVYDTGRHQTTPYVVSELLQGETLRERMSAAALPIPKAIDYAVQIARGLAAAHDKGIVHRDLKPENLFVTKDGLVKILDFGLAKFESPDRPAEGADEEVETLSRETRPGVMMGTAGYMSPEQVRGRTVDHRCDVFSFGAVLYEMLSGQRAFRGDSSVEILSAILKEEPGDLARTKPDLPLALLRIVARCLEKKPEERFQSARDLAFHLEQVAQGAGSGSASASVSRSVVAGMRRGPHRAVGAVALAGLAAAAVFLLVRGWRSEETAGLPEAGRVESIAVLPFDNLSGDPEREYYADGMTDALISSLSQIKALRVVSRTSCMRFKDVHLPLREIAEELGVDALVEGSVAQGEGRVLIRAKLLEPVAERQLWAAEYERPVRDVLTLHGEVARAIAGQIGAALTPEESLRLSAERPVDPEAYDEYVRGLAAFSSGDRPNAASHFEAAIGVDPGFPQAYASLSIANSWGAYEVGPPGVTLERARLSAERALELDDGLAEAHVAMGGVLQREWEWEASESEFRRALELNPSSAEAHFHLSILLSHVGRPDEALGEAERAVVLDPRDPLKHIALGWVHWWAGRHEKALERFRAVLAVEPDHPMAQFNVGMVLNAQGRHDEALAAIRRARELAPGLAFIRGAEAQALAGSGQIQQARAILAELEHEYEAGAQSPTGVAEIHLALGDKEQALAWLEKAYRERDLLLANIAVEPWWDPLRDDPRFIDILRRMRLE